MPGTEVNINCSGFEEASFNGANAAYVTLSGPTDQTSAILTTALTGAAHKSGLNPTTSMSGPPVDRNDSALQRTTRGLLDSSTLSVYRGRSKTDYHEGHL